MNPGHNTTVFLCEQHVTTITTTATTAQCHDIMLRSNCTRLPADVFSIGDRVKCVNPRSKHYAPTARVLGMGKTRLNVKFDNGHNGKFIDWRDAELVSPPVEPVAADTANRMDPTSVNVGENDDI